MGLTQTGSSNPVAPNCDALLMGTLPGLDDVIREGAVRSQFLAGDQLQYLQSQPHAFYLDGAQGLLRGDPTVYSMNRSPSAASGEEGSETAARLLGFVTMQPG